MEILKQEIDILITEIFDDEYNNKDATQGSFVCI